MSESAQLFGVRVMCGAGFVYLLCRHEPAFAVDAAGNLDVSSWGVIDTPNADRLLFLRAEAVTGIALRAVVDPVKIAKLESRSLTDAEVLAIDAQKYPDGTRRRCPTCSRMASSRRRICPYASCGSTAFRSGVEVDSDGNAIERQPKRKARAPEPPRKPREPSQSPRAVRLRKWRETALRVCIGCGWTAESPDIRRCKFCKAELRKAS